jgi:hypothetical protein
MLIDEHGDLFDIETDDAVDVVNYEVVKNTIHYLDDISFSEQTIRCITIIRRCMSRIDM